MASPPLQVGSWVQYNAAFDSPRSSRPSSEEQTVGIIRQAFFDKGDPYYQVVWNPGDLRPRSALYRGDELTSVNQKDAQSILAQVRAGTYQPDQQAPGSQYVQPNIPVQGLPPGLGTFGTFSATEQPTDNPPELQQTS